MSHCPHCGAEVTSGLKFCKRCGGHLQAFSQTEATPTGFKQTSAAWAVALATTAICLIGLTIVFSHAYDIMRPDPFGGALLGDPTLVAILMLTCGSVTIFGVCALLIRLFSKLLLGAEARGRRDKTAKAQAVSYAPPQIPAPSVGVPSVTEHTTRNFEQAPYREP